MTDYQHLLNRMRELETRIDQLESALKNEFVGELHCNKDRTRYRWRITTIQNDGTKTSETISQKDRLSAEKAAEVTIERAELRDCQAEYKACLKYVSVYRKSDGSFPEMILPKRAALMHNPGFTDLLHRKLSQREQQLIAWENEEFDNGKDYYPQQLNIKVTDTLYVRSKSERAIALALIESGLHFRYEWRQNIMGEIIPDFTIIHPKTGVLYYWEHFGLIDSESYRKDFFSKLYKYTSCEIYPDDRLIMTFETKERPLDIQTIKEKIQKAFF